MPVEQAGYTDVPISNIRNVIAKRLCMSKQVRMCPVKVSCIFLHYYIIYLCADFLCIDMYTAFMDLEKTYDLTD